MKMRLVLWGSLLAAMYAWGGCVEASDQPVQAACVPQPSRNAEAPRYPQEALQARIAGEVILVIAIDSCGAPSDVVVERSSGNPSLDSAAIEAARTWHFDPGKSRVRVPVKFDPSEGAGQSGRPRDTFFWERRSMKVPPPKLDAAGHVPGYVPDQYPIGVSSIEGAIAMLDAHATRGPDPQPGVRNYRLLDEEGMSAWTVISETGEDGRGVYRVRAVGDGTRGFWVISALCEPPQSGMCKGFWSYLAGFTPQPDVPPPPPAPPLQPIGH